MAQVTIGDQVFELRPFTGRVRMEHTRIVNEIGGHEDRIEALDGRMLHAGRRLASINDKDPDGEFDTAAQDAILAERERLRAAAQGVSDDLVKAQMRLVAVMLMDPPDEDFLIEHLDMEVMGKVMAGVGDQEDAGDPPTESPSPDHGDGS